LNQLRKRLTYANVMSTIAVFLVLGGATAFAAGLGKNSVGSKQLKKNSVTAAKIKNGAVTGAKIQDGAVTGAKIQDGAITGAKVTAGSLGVVPNASHAAHADTADTAGNANATNGQHLARLDFRVGANTPKTAIFSANGLTLFAECSDSNQLDFTATNSIPDAEIFESGNYDDTFKGGYFNNFEPGETASIGAEIGDGSQQEVLGRLVYLNPSGGTVTAQFVLEDSGALGQFKCAVVGTVQYS
jgi:hypothetical protein